MEPNPVAELSQSLKAAGIHPSQTDPVMLQGDIYPPVKMPKPPRPHFVKARSPDEIKDFSRRLAD